MLTGELEFTSFAEVESDEINKNLSLYDANELNQRYQNFLNWLFKTFKTDELSFRKGIFTEPEVKEKMKILITSVGNGDDIISLTDIFPPNSLEIYSQDINSAMCEFTMNRLLNMGIRIKEMNVSNISRLPYKSDFFDLVFHFGGINWITDKQNGINEMVRVCKNYGRVGIVDESVGEWLRDHEYGKMMIENNALWGAKVPLDLLPANVNKVRIAYILENCFYFLSFIKDPRFPNVDLNIKHLGPRGGSIRKRYFGRLEGISPELLEEIRLVAAREKMSISDWLEFVLSDAVSE
jgi:SAM-dependent methyltransferase